MAKRLIVCCDGTWTFADPRGSSNVFKIAQLIRGRGADAEQRVYYQSGGGIRRWRLFGGSLGVGLTRNVIDAYGFLIHNYEPGDQLYLFGFSRGAYTARTLAGLVRSSGILPPKESSRVKEAWALYRSRVEYPNGLAPTLFRRAHAHETGIEFIGVWDTVGTLGIPFTGPLARSSAVMRQVNRRSGFRDTALPIRVKGAFHALAIDEQRVAFRPTLWHQRPEAADSGQELKQVWFSGAHADIGGGYPDTQLSDITLLWMVAQATRYGVEFDVDTFGESGQGFTITPNALGPVHDSRVGLCRLAPPLHRPIGKASDRRGRPDGCEYLADTARRRFESNPGYQPPELAQYLHQPDAHFESMSMSTPGTEAGFGPP
ncbi:DUF2235 domain-containing protein [Streptomyces sp. NPDC050548]|uniref:DUF2235 domain-containing protein n=1 Tax=Streptomyces sp. NPDC050548 TaxID=3365629 RepID=UPI0037BBE3C4